MDLGVFNDVYTCSFDLFHMKVMHHKVMHHKKLNNIGLHIKNNIAKLIYPCSNLDICELWLEKVRTKSLGVIF